MSVLFMEIVNVCVFYGDSPCLFVFLNIPVSVVYSDIPVSVVYGGSPCLCCLLW